MLRQPRTKTVYTKEQVIEIKRLLKEAKWINPWDLPSVPVSTTRYLPEFGQGVYFVLFEHEVIYIGVTGRSLRHRWVNHQKKKEILALPKEDEGIPQVAYWEPETKVFSWENRHLLVLESYFMNKFSRALINKNFSSLAQMFQ